jgi:hypothetical protein
VAEADGPELEGVAQRSGVLAASADPGQVGVVQPEEPFQLLSGRLPEEVNVRSGLIIGEELHRHRGSR